MRCVCWPDMIIRSPGLPRNPASPAKAISAQCFRKECIAVPHAGGPRLKTERKTGSSAPLPRCPGTADPNPGIPAGKRNAFFLFGRNDREERTFRFFTVDFPEKLSIMKNSYHRNSGDIAMTDRNSIQVLERAFLILEEIANSRMYRIRFRSWRKRRDSRFRPFRKSSGR